MKTPLISFWLALAIGGAETIESRIHDAYGSFQQGDYAGALAQFGELERLLSGSPITPAVVNVRSMLALVHTDRTNYREAEIWNSRALDACRQLAPRDVICAGAIRGNQLRVYFEAGWHGKAERLIEELKKDFSEAAPAGNPQLLVIEGDVLFKRNRFAEAEGLYQRALDLVKSSTVREQEGYVWNSIGMVRARQKKRRDACVAFRQSVEAHERNFGENYPAIAYPLTSLANCLLRDGDPHAAERLTERAERIAVQSLGGAPRTLYTILTVRAQALDRMKLKDEAKQIRQRAEEIQHAMRIQEFTVTFDDLGKK